MANCSYCGIEVAGAALYCPSCGKPLINTDDVATIDLASAMLPKSSSSRSGMPSSRSSGSEISGLSDFLVSEGRFLPGRLVAGRYRIIALLGRGGMGEVYRADDLTLGQAVAIKFLPDEATRDEGMRERFKNEVRIARRISHPNVCRVYDVGDVEGQTFFTMEYVDGEDLASLLRRIGRLPQDKALDIARQLCAGLAAAHAKGVLHRDLKPANIMLDGRGQVVITDFGLAGVADDIRGPEVRSGTPAYMAPEQLSGKEVSPRSDIYALGLVLYEVFTGKRAFAETPARLLHAGGDRTPSRPSSVIKDLDPIVEKVILRCLETEPTARPATALAVAGALPGGDPLAAALAAGETPSPQLVAASGETTGLRPGVALGLLIAILVGLSVGSYLTIRYSAVDRMHLEQPPIVLAEKAREIVARLGYPEKPADTAYGFEYDTDFRDALEKDKKNPPSWDEVIAGRPNMLQFWYRQSQQFMTASDYTDFLLIPGIVREEDPRTTDSGMINVRLDPKGRLTYFQQIPPQKDLSEAHTSAPDWGPLLAAAELDPAKLQTASPQWNSLASADTRAAWTGVWPDSNRPLRVEAAAWHGKPVFFSMIGDWTKPGRMVDPSADNARNRAAQIIGLILVTSLLLAGGLLARRNLRQGRADREGALRLAVVMFSLEILLCLCRSHLAPNFQTFGTLMLTISSGLFWASMAWMLYLAIEPWIRRRWPHAMISWTRLLSGQFRDPVLGRDILLGVAFGTVWILIFGLSWIPLTRMGAAPQLNATAYLLGGRQALGQWLIQIPISIFATLQFFFFLLGLKVLLRKDWLAAIAFVIFFTGWRALQSTHPSVEVPAMLLIYAVLVLIVFRFGLVPLAIAAFTVDMLANVPLTTDFSAWYVGTTVLAFLSVVTIAGWGFYHSLGGAPVWKVEME